MATAAQIVANRANAQKSTGPRTAEGKENSRRNAIDHNLTGTRCLRTKEEQAAFDAYSDRILPTLTPADEFQLEIARRIVSTMFRLAQVPTIEASMIAAVRFSENAGFDPPIADLTNAMALGTAFLENSKAFNNLSLYEQRLSRGMEKDLELLRKLQREAPAQQKPAVVKRAVAKQAIPSQVFAATSDEIGFVYSTSASDPAPPLSASRIDPKNRAA